MLTSSNDFLRNSNDFLSQKVEPNLGQETYNFLLGNAISSTYAANPFDISLRSPEQTMQFQGWEVEVLYSPEFTFAPAASIAPVPQLPESPPSPALSDPEDTKRTRAPQKKRGSGGITKATLKHQINQLNKEKNKLKEKVSRIDQKYLDLLRQFDAVVKEKNALQHSIKEMNSDNPRNMSHLRQAQQLILKLFEENGELKNSEASLKEKNMNLETEKAKLETEGNMLKVQNALLKRSLATAVGANHAGMAE